MAPNPLMARMSLSRPRPRVSQPGWRSRFLAREPPRPARWRKTSWPAAHFRSRSAPGLFRQIAGTTRSAGRSGVVAATVFRRGKRTAGTLVNAATASGRWASRNRRSARRQPVVIALGNSSMSRRYASYSRSCQASSNEVTGSAVHRTPCRGVTPCGGSIARVSTTPGVGSWRSTRRRSFVRRIGRRMVTRAPRTVASVGRQAAKERRGS